MIGWLHQTDQQCPYWLTNHSNVNFAGLHLKGDQGQLCFRILSDGSEETKKQIWKFWYVFVYFSIQPDKLWLSWFCWNPISGCLNTATLTPQTNISIIKWTNHNQPDILKIHSQPKASFDKHWSPFDVFERISQRSVWQQWTQSEYKQNWESQDLFDLQALEREVS